MQWLYGLFLDLIAYCANALLGVMSTDLEFFETSVPITASLYRVFVAVGWGLLIGNLAFQSMKAMFAGFGFETESPAVLLLRTFLFGTLLVFSRDICDIGLSIGKNVINLLGIPDSVTLTLPDEGFFTGGASWLLVIIIGFILGFQLIKLFFEIAERYVIVAVLTLLCPIGLSMGGSKSTKDICAGFMRTYASMIVMMVLNVLFLKLVLSALAAMPSGVMVLPWCLLVVGIVKTARKADNMISKIGMSPAVTGDPLSHGGGRFAAMMAARTIINSAAKSGSSKSGGRNAAGSAKTYNGAAYSNVNSASGGSSFNTNGTESNRVTSNSGVNNQNSGHSMQTSRTGGDTSTVNTNSQASSRFGSSGMGAMNSSSYSSFGGVSVGHSGNTQVNTNRFGNGGMTGGVKPTAPIMSTPSKTAGAFDRKVNGTLHTDKSKNRNISSAKTTTKTAPRTSDVAKKSRFGSTANKPENSINPQQKGIPGSMTAAKSPTAPDKIKKPPSVLNTEPKNAQTQEINSEIPAEGDNNE